MALRTLRGEVRALCLRYILARLLGEERDARFSEVFWLGDRSPARAASSENAAQVAAARYAGASRNCCRSPPQCLAHEANGHVRDIPESGIERSNRADIA